ncbi:MAG: 23S rRNA (uracil1939-C5)-methyltransferase [Polaribacter sp.]|jgi:23S rRNA (uracil1939-C5)-methyltransferase|tara:strand:+ start:3268 stop:4575 length:1308 start_codon:yes stop_codon:yes gene_type:complete
MGAKPSLSCEINDLLHDGRGVGRINGKAFFVEGALPGEDVEFRVTNEKRNFAEARLTKVLSASQYRTEPECRYFSKCGGCSLQHLQHSEQIEFKKQQLLNSAQRVGLEPENTLDSLVGPQWNYRRRARLAVQRARDGQFLVGFHNPGSNRIEPIASCMVLDKSLDALLMALPSILNALGADIKIFEIELVAADNALAVAVEASRSLFDAELTSVVKALNVVAEMTTQLWWKVSKNGRFSRVDDGEDGLYFGVKDDIKLSFEPGQFIQVNDSINRSMIEQMLALVSVENTGVAIDLFCGSGNLSLPLAKQFNQVIGVEGLASLVVAANGNARSNAIDNTQFVVADLNDAASLKKVSKIASSIDLIVLDPPRNGAAAIMPWVAKSGTKQIIYISCHSSTMVRDADFLIRAGYKLKNLGVMDMFPHTAHVESMALFEK